MPAKVSHIAKLASKARQLNRTIYASLPLGYRIAQVMLKLSMSSQEAFGKAIYAEFIKADITGMPPINGEPAETWKDKLKGPRGALRLPSGYGISLGAKAYAVAVRKLGDPEVVEDALSAVATKLAMGKMHLNPGDSLSNAERYIISSVMRAGIDAYRAKHRDYDRSEKTHATPLSIEDLDVSDPRAFKEIEQSLPPATLKRIYSEVAKIDPPRSLAWLEAQLEGLSDRELAQEWGISAARVSQITGRYKTETYQIFKKYLSAAA